MLFIYLAFGSTQQKTPLYSTSPGNERCLEYAYVDTSDQQ
jgi:hypothetical protein